MVFIGLVQLFILVAQNILSRELKHCQCITLTHINNLSVGQNNQVKTTNIQIQDNYIETLNKVTCGLHVPFIGREEWRSCAYLSQTISKTRVLKLI